MNFNYRAAERSAANAVRLAENTVSFDDALLEKLISYRAGRGLFGARVAML